MTRCLIRFASITALDVTASECTACEACEERCPFGVKIASKMAKAQELFGC